MKKGFYLLAAGTVLLASCSESFKKTGEGIEYKIISDGKGKTIQNGQFFELQFDRSYKSSTKDSSLGSSKDYINQIVALDSTSGIPPIYYKIFAQTRKGDSLVIKQLTDSIMKSGNTPPFIKKGNYIISNYKIVNVFTTRESADSAYKAQMVLAKSKDSIKAIEQLKTDDKAVADYLAKNKIQATKAPAGTYVEILTPGEGNPLDTSNILKVLYTGKTLTEGTVFDSNTDPKFGHPEAFPVDLGATPGTQGSVIKGWTDGLSILKKGAKARLYIPSALAYGAQGAGKDIKPNANLLFDVEIVDVITRAQAIAESMNKRKQMEMEQQKYMDSAKAAAKDSTKR